MKTTLESKMSESPQYAYMLHEEFCSQSYKDSIESDDILRKFCFSWAPATQVKIFTGAGASGQRFLQPVPCIRDGPLSHESAGLL